MTADLHQLEPLSLGTARAGLGQKAWGQLHVREGAQSVRLPVAVLQGARPGPHVVVLANQHGTELNGIEAARQFVETVNPHRLKGSVFVIPSANPRAALALQSVWLEGKLPRGMDPYASRYNMNFNWPGEVGGLLVQRVTHALFHRAILAPHRRADFVLDLHGHQGPTAVYAADRQVAHLGVIAGISRVVITGGDGKNSCSGECNAIGIPAMTIELGGQADFFGESISAGRRAIFNLLKHFGLLSGAPEWPAASLVLDPWRDHRDRTRTHASPSYVDYKAGHAGLVIPRKRHYDMVRKGETVCDILDPFTARIVESCPAAISGAIYNYRTGGRAACTKGQTLFTVSIARHVHAQNLKIKEHQESS
jgi:uncharacterized protein